MSRYQWLVFLAAWLGWGFDVFDGLLFNFVALVNDVFTKRIPGLAADPDLAWRLVFLAGLVPAAFALWIRRRVREPEAWTQEGGATRSLGELFAPGLRRATLGGLGLCVVNLSTWW